MGLLEEGQVIRDTYHVERFLGEGAFAEVYRVRHRFLGRQAMKVFKMVGMTIKETELMLSEALMLSRMGHPNIIRVFDANITETSAGVCGFFTMEYVAGGSLEQFWRSHGMDLVPIDTTIDIIKQVCSGLAVAHVEKPPIVHRDIKPQNILVGYAGDGLHARVSDFGLAKRVNPLTLLASARGTRGFKSPEALKDLQSDSCAGDVWAIGTTLYLLLTDRIPYADEGQGFDSIDLRMYDRPLVAASRFNIQVDAHIEAILARALKINPTERYANAKELLDDLKRWRPAKGPIPASTSTFAGSEQTKTALGVNHSPVNQETARRMANEALKLSRVPGKLIDAADMMEEAFNKWPALRNEHEYKVQLWRRGICM